MTLEDLMNTLNKELFGMPFDTTNPEYLLKIEYTKRSPYPYDDQEYETEENVTKIDIDNNNKTITFKGENK